MTKSLIFVIGKMGAGKNYVCEAIGKECGYKPLDGDQALAWYNRGPIKFLFKESGLLKKYMSVENYVRNHLVPWIEHELKSNDCLAISQALYFEDHRTFLAEYFKEHKVRFVYVKAPPEQHKEQLSQRDGCWGRFYASANDSSFEELHLKGSA